MAPSLSLHIEIHTSDLQPQQFDVLRKREQLPHISLQFIQHLLIWDRWKFLVLHEFVGGELIGPPALWELQGFGS